MVEYISALSQDLYIYQTVPILRKGWRRLMWWRPSFHCTLILVIPKGKFSVWEGLIGSNLPSISFRGKNNNVLKEGEDYEYQILYG